MINLIFNANDKEQSESLGWYGILWETLKNFKLQAIFLYFPFPTYNSNSIYFPQSISRIPA